MKTFDPNYYQEPEKNCAGHHKNGWIADTVQEIINQNTNVLDVEPNYRRKSWLASF